MTFAARSTQKRPAAARVYGQKRRENHRLSPLGFSSICESLDDHRNTVLFPGSGVIRIRHLFRNGILCHLRNMTAEFFHGIRNCIILIAEQERMQPYHVVG